MTTDTDPRCRSCGTTYARTDLDGGICPDCDLDGVKPT